MLSFLFESERWSFLNEEGIIYIYMSFSFIGYGATQGNKHHALNISESAYIYAFYYLPAPIISQSFTLSSHTLYYCVGNSKSLHCRWQILVIIILRWQHRERDHNAFQKAWGWVHAINLYLIFGLLRVNKIGKVL